VAAADCDGGAVVKVASPRAIATSLLLSSLTACATAMDDTRNGSPVVETTLAAIKADPPAWEGKWVRLEGWSDDKDSVLTTSPSDSDGREHIKLDPQRRPRSPDGTDNWTATKRAIVSGQVDLTCWRFWHEDVPQVRAAAEKEGRTLGDVRANGLLEYCNRVFLGPHLVQVLSAPVAESAQ
jgi:hypothetical protein